MAAEVLDMAAQAPGAEAPAEAASEGKGGKPRASKPRGSNRVIDWGRYNFLLENFALIYGTDTVWDKSRRRVMKVANMAHAWGTDYVRLWKAADNRWTIMPEQMVFDPTMKCSDECVNLYNGFALQPAHATEEDVEPMLELLRHLCGETTTTDGKTSSDDVVQWVLRWLAIMLQQPGAKMATALVFHGPQGTGKNLFFEAVGRIFGDYARMIGQSELEEKYNDWLSAKLMIIANEVVSRQELYHNKNKIKWIITEKVVPIRSMYQDIRWESNHANLVFLSNELQPLVLEDGDRRYLVVYTPVGDETGLYKRVVDFLENGGAELFMGYLLQLHLGDFNVHTKPPMTQAKADLIELSMRPAERFMHEWLSGFLALPMQVCSAEQLYRAFRRWCDQSGEKYPPSQSLFTRTAERWVKERIDRDDEGRRRPPRLIYKVVNLKTSMGARKAMRCWLPSGTGPRDPSISEGEWAASCVDTFESALSAFCRRSADPEFGGDPV